MPEPQGFASLGDVVQILDSRRIPLSGLQRDARPGPFPYYGAAAIMGQVDDFLFEGPHVLIGEDGSVVSPEGKPVLQFATGKFWVNNHAHVVKCERLTDTRFLYYALQTVDIRPFVTGSVQPKLNQGNLKQVRIPWPDPKERDRIVAVLDCLQEKMDANDSASRTAEAFAHALFVSWFVDFAPSRALALNQRHWSLTPAAEQVFPKRLKASEMGEIPEGWTIAALSRILQVNPKRVVPKGTDAPYIEMQDLPTAGPVVFHERERPPAGGSRFQNGDTLLARLTPCLENGKAGMVANLRDDQVGWGSTEFLVFRPVRNLPTSLAYLYIRWEPVKSHAVANMSGSSGRQRTPASCFDHFPVTIAPDGVYQEFGKVVDPLFEWIQKMGQQNRLLARLQRLLVFHLLAWKDTEMGVTA
jgi:type I restriction enzyme, S subunit